MDSFNSSPAMLNIVIKTKVKKIFQSGIYTNYQADDKWLDRAIDTLIYTFNAKKQTTNEIIGLEDYDILDECVEALVEQICQSIEQGIKLN